MVQHFKRHALVYLGVLATVTGLASAAFRPTEWQFWALIAAAGGAVLLQSIVGQRALASARAVQDEFKVAVWDQLGPLSRELGRMSTEKRDKRKAMLDGTVQLAVACASGLAGDHTRTRATFFAKTYKDGYPAFVPRQSAGRGDVAQSIFKKGAGSAEGDAVWDYAERDLGRYVVDVTKTPPPGWDASRKRVYRTFITVPVRCGDNLVGLLTVNAANPRSFSENDVETMSVIASLIGTAIGMSRTD